MSQGTVSRGWCCDPLVSSFDSYPISVQWVQSAGCKQLVTIYLHIWSDEHLLSPIT